MKEDKKQEIKGKLILTKKTIRFDIGNEHIFFYLKCQDCYRTYNISKKIENAIKKDSFLFEIFKHNPIALFGQKEVNHCIWCYEDFNKYYHVREIEYKKMGYNLKKLKERFIKSGKLDPKKLENNT